MYFAVQIVFLILFIAALLWIDQQRRRMLRLRMNADEAYRAQDAVIALIDKLGQKITSKIDLEGTLEIITKYLVEMTGAESGAVFQVANGEDGPYLQARVVEGPFPPLHETHEHVLTKQKYLTAQVKKDRIRLGEGIVGLVAQEGRPVLIRDALLDERVSRVATQLNEIRSIMLSPLQVRGDLLGVFVVVNKADEEAFEEHDMNLLQSLADMAAVTVELVKLYDVLGEQQRLEQELKVAHEFQNMLLPQSFPELDGYEVYGMSRAATVVGGDFFDCFPVDDDHMGLVIADVSGKGIPGALVMATVRSALRAEARGDLSPKAVLKRVNESIVGDIKENVFITMTYGILDLHSGLLRFVRAGHEPLVVIDQAHDNRIEQLAPEGIALGQLSGDLFEFNEEMDVQLRPNEAALLYTDGVVEAMDQNNEEYGHDRLMSRIEAQNHPTAYELIDKIMEDIHTFTLGLPQHDDITMLAVRMLRPAQAQAQDEVVARRAAG